jgi:hypothetical protein
LSTFFLSSTFSLPSSHFFSTFSLFWHGYVLQLEVNLNFATRKNVTIWRHHIWFHWRVYNVTRRRWCHWVGLCFDLPPPSTPTARPYPSLFHHFSTYLCEQTFCKMKLTKSTQCSQLTDAHLHALLRVSVSNFEPDIVKLSSNVGTTSNIVLNVFSCFFFIIIICNYFSFLDWEIFRALFHNLLYFPQGLCGPNLARGP